MTKHIELTDSQAGEKVASDDDYMPFTAIMFKLMEDSSVCTMDLLSSDAQPSPCTTAIGPSLTASMEPLQLWNCHDDCKDVCLKHDYLV